MKNVVPFSRVGLSNKPANPINPTNFWHWAH